MGFWLGNHYAVGLRHLCIELRKRTVGVRGEAESSGNVVTGIGFA
jgi:hypothetical protein